MTIEERASEFVNISLHDSIKGAIRYTYIYAATEQRKIDIEKAYEWIKSNFDSDEGGEIELCFRKAMEEEV